MCYLLLIKTYSLVSIAYPQLTISTLPRRASHLSIAPGPRPGNHRDERCGAGYQRHVNHLSVLTNPQNIN